MLDQLNQVISEAIGYQVNLGKTQRRQTKKERLEIEDLDNKGVRS